MSKILITGSSGFLGSVLVNELSSNNSVICLSRNSGTYKVTLEKDIPDFQHSFNLVIHAAGKAHSISRNQIERKLFHDINVNGTKNLLNGLELIGFSGRFVFISSVSVYGLEFGNNIDENHHLCATDPYGYSKIQAEKLVIEWCKKNNVICSILRLPLLVGENPPGNLGSMIDAIKKGYYFNIGGGFAKKSMVLAQDVATFIPKISKIGGIYNLTDGYHPTFAELSNNISSQLGCRKPKNIPLWVARIISKLGDFIGEKSPINTSKLNKITTELTFDDKKARKAFGWSPVHVLTGFKIQ